MSRSLHKAIDAKRCACGGGGYGTWRLHAAACRDYCRTHGKPTAWAWVRENRGGTGIRVNILLHQPDGEGWDNGRPAMRWLKRVTGKPNVPGMLRSVRLSGNPVTSPADYATNLNAVLPHILKGASTDAASTLNIHKQSPQGRIIGKRAETSQNFGQAARKACINPKRAGAHIFSTRLPIPKTGECLDF